MIAKGSEKSRSIHIYIFISLCTYFFASKRIVYGDTGSMQSRDDDI